MTETSVQICKPKTTAAYHSSGQLLSETDTGVDYLEASVYANAIAESIHDARTSITIGIYAKWGSGKSFLLRHIESVLRRFQNQDELDRDGAGKVSYGWYKSNRLLWWTSALLFTFLVFILSVIMAADPAFFYPSPQGDQTNQAVNTSTPMPLSTLSKEQSRLETLQTIKIVGCVLIPIEIIAVFVIASFGVWPSSRKSRGRTQILWYAVFTKIPVQRDQVDIVEDPGLSPTEMLENVEKGDEMMAMVATPAIRFPRRYIFVNFKAWEYAGSDTLWAAIVTNISDAIEAEFGVVTTRLFRTLSVTEVPKKHLGASNKTLYIQFTSGTTSEQVMSVMKRYGVVTSVKLLPGNTEFKWFEISYATDGEFRNAKDSLTVEGVDVRTTSPEPISNDGVARNQNGRESARPLIRDNFEASREDYNDYDSVVEDEAPPRLECVSALFCCCRRFCTHFIRYPVTFCKLPRLYWWIVLFVASFLIPITAYIVANALSIRTAQTWWNVPPYAQVLLWLPGPLSVAVFASKFAWALCHSQTRRIHQAMDGIQGKMASQLGFMSTVAIMINLIRCARFVLQKDYRVIITIDDLDQLNLKKVHSVLEATSILLSDKSSPFVCLIAADPRIVVKCVEENLGDVLKNADVSGREYLKKIINLPVCLPELNESIKKRYIAGLIDQSDDTITYTKQHTKNVNDEGGDQVDGARRIESNAADVQDIGREKFLFECRKCLYDNKDLRRHIQGNARNMKRIFNVISLTSCLINTIVKKQKFRAFLRNNMKGEQIEALAVEGYPKIVRTKKLAEKLVHWIVLVDGWPYRTSFIVQVIMDADQREVAGLTDTRIPGDWDILEIYLRKVQEHMTDPDGNLATLDGDPDLFQTYLLLLAKRGFTKTDILRLLRLTINLDYSIRRRIALNLVPPPVRSPTQMSETNGGDGDAIPSIEMRAKRRDKISLQSFSHYVDGASVSCGSDEAETEC